MKIAAFSSLLVATLLVIASARDSQPAASSGLARRHHAKTARAMEEHQLSKRSFKGKATWYATYPGDMGACGTHLQQGDYFVALNQGQYGNLDSQSSYCGKTITITNGLKTTQATILDACPKTTQCHYGALDMSRDLFSYFNDFGVGVFDITWWINGEGGDSGSSSSNNNDSSDDDDAAAKKKAAQEKAAKEKAAQEKAAQEKQDKEDAAKKAAAEKKKKEEEAAAKKKAAAEKKKKEEEEAKKKAAAKKKAEAKEAKKKAEKEAKEKIETAQHQNLAAFGEIMQQLNHLVADAITTDGGSSTASASASSSA